MRRGVRASWIVAALFLGAAAAAQPAVPALTGRVVDTAELLDAETEVQLTTLLTTLEDSTSHQVVVLTVPSLEGEAIEPLATRVFNTWGLGQAGLNNGILLLVARDDRRLRIEVGVGLEAILTDAEAGRIIRRVIVPRFRDGDFEEGVRAGVIAIDKEVRGETAQAGPLAPPGDTPPRLSGYERPKTPWGRLWWFFAYDTGWLGVLVAPAVLLILYGLAYWFLVGSFSVGHRWVVFVWVLVFGSIGTFFLFIFGGEVAMVALYDRSVREGAWLWLAPLSWLALLLGVDRWMATHPVWQRWRQAMARVARLKRHAIKDKKKVTIHTWGKTITFDGKRRASGGGYGGGFSSGGFSSGGGFSGGGGFSSGGGASGGW